MVSCKRYRNPRIQIRPTVLWRSHVKMSDSLNLSLRRMGPCFLIASKLLESTPYNKVITAFTVISGRRFSRRTGRESIRRPKAILRDLVSRSCLDNSCLKKSLKLIKFPVAVMFSLKLRISNLRKFSDSGGKVAFQLSATSILVQALRLVVPFIAALSLRPSWIRKGPRLTSCTWACWHKAPTQISYKSSQRDQISSKKKDLTCQKSQNTALSLASTNRLSGSPIA